MDPIHNITRMSTVLPLLYWACLSALLRIAVASYNASEMEPLHNIAGMSILFLFSVLCLFVQIVAMTKASGSLSVNPWKSNYSNQLKFSYSGNCNHSCTPNDRVLAAHFKPKYFVPKFSTGITYYLFSLFYQQSSQSSAGDWRGSVLILWLNQSPIFFCLLSYC